MQAVIMKKNGGPGVVEVRDMPRPTIGADDVLIEVRAASLNPVDIKIRNGLMNVIHKYRFPHIMGCDLSGTIVEVGAAVSTFSVGDEVFAYTGADRLGAFAEFIALPASAVARKPSSVSWAEAASVPLVSLTVLKALIDVAHVKAGQRLFLRTGSGGTGVYGVQLAKILGLDLITTTSTANVEWVKALGADTVIDYKKSRFEDEVSACDVVLETLPKAEMLRSFKVIKPGGHFISIGDLPDAGFAKSIGKNGFFQLVFGLLSASATRAARQAGCDYHFFLVGSDGARLSQIAGWVDEGRIKPVVDTTYPLDEAREALDYLAAGRARGKVVLIVKP